MSARQRVEVRSAMPIDREQAKSLILSLHLATVARLDAGDDPVKALVAAREMIDGLLNSARTAEPAGKTSGPQDQPAPDPLADLGATARRLVEDLKDPARRDQLLDDAQLLSRRVEDGLRIAKAAFRGTRPR